MNVDDVRTALAKAAAYDRREPNQATVHAWLEALGDLDLPDVLDAIAEHFRTTDAYLMPVHIRRIVEPIVVRRREAAAQAAEVQRQQRQAIEAPPAPVGHRSVEAEAAIAQVRAQLRPGKPEALHRPEWFPVSDASGELHRQALNRSRAERQGGPFVPPPRRHKSGRQAAMKPTRIPPATKDVAALASHYLRDGYTPEDVSARLEIDVAWCRRRAAELRREPAPGLWCGFCLYETRMVKASATAELSPCPRCHPAMRSENAS